ncbi:MAG: hypothetical protein N2V77_06115 [Canidatus Methanoxibalbensis ujae]|nr:hypothetical protein [Candidatus Methanoxibalbensis ujae]MCW7078650.1 hypothetical protein [Candidatus Methanoxibalbensis ujae]
MRGGPFSGEVFCVGMIIASYDVVALDCFACSLLGIQPENVKHIKPLRTLSALVNMR